MRKEKDKLTILVDFDGVLHSYRSGWKGVGTIPDPPVEGAVPWLQAMLERYDVAIYSSRSRQPEGVQAMKVALAEWARESGMSFDASCRFVERLSFPTEKPAAWITIDDRCICFDGHFPTLEDIEGFMPWYRR